MTLPQGGWRRSDRPRNNRWTDRSFQKQCKVYGQHAAHHYERGDRLIWYCQGRAKP